MKTLIKKSCDITGIPSYFLQNNIREIQMLLVRMYSLLPMQKIKIKRIQKKSSIKLNFGCGQTNYTDWVNIDSFFAKHIDLTLDLRRKIPFKNNSVDFCYSEHFFEHLYPEEGIKHLNEVNRVLKTGGIYRMVVPAGIRFVEKYLQKDDAFFRLAFPWEERPMDVIYNILNWHGEHRNIFDLDQLHFLAKKAGFSRVKECGANQSQIPELRIDKSDPQRVAESLYVEFYK
jgi:predicted SAM-dependent methyltransferase